MSIDRKRCHFVDIPEHVESDGRLIVVEENTDVIPFDIKRIFWVRDVLPGASRGDHATKKTHLILIPVTGSCDVVVHDGTEEETFHMDDPTRGLYLDNMLWRSMRNFKDGCIMEALCDLPYAPGDETYDDFDEFLKALGK